MAKLHIVQAAFGDCFILEYGTTAKPRFTLIDGGPDAIYDGHLRGVLKKIANAGGVLDLVLLSHVDNDHALGMLALFTELEKLRVNEKAPLIEVRELWHNSFKDTIDQTEDISPRVGAIVKAGGKRMVATAKMIAAVGQGRTLRLRAQQLGIAINKGFKDQIIRVETATKTIKKGNLSIRVVGPTKRNLDALRAEWIEWLNANEKRVMTKGAQVAAMVDSSVPNLSSVVLVAKVGSTRMLLTGDARGDHILDGLKAAKLLDQKGRLHVEIFKVQHHGSDRNSTAAFFNAITADIYVVSADGTHGNPDFATLKWIVSAAKKQKRKIELVVTNETASVKKLREKCPAAEYGYKLTVMKKSAHALAIPLS